ncbi:MAG: 5'-nucleotidase C-terminal domain-containing protein [Pedobacter sp.]|nr:5'-nucleotidase C-terminal domain-containing protein [Pedobacter sp.]
MIKCNSHFTTLILFSVLCLFACKGKYQITQTKRAEYNINNDLPVDSNIIKTYNPYKVQMEAEMNKVIAHSNVLMSKVESDKNPESLLSNFFADATFHEAQKIDNNIDFAIPTSKGGLRMDISKGEVTMSNIFETMPFENELIVFTLSGTDTQNLINFIALNNGEPVSGLRMKIVDKKPVNITIKGKPFDASKSYRILTTDYLAGGGDNFQSFKKPIDKKHLGLKVRTALINYVQNLEKEGKNINPILDGRITKN